MKLKKSGCKFLENIVLFDQSTEEQKIEAKSAGLNLYDFKDIIEVGRGHPELVLTDPTPDSIYMFCYTSGTTGDPKGAKLTHKGFLGAM